MKNIVETTSEILELVKEFELEEFELETKDSRIKLSTVPLSQRAAPMIPQQSPITSAAPLAAPSPAENSSAPEIDDSDLITISSPMVGTFYRKPGPEKPAYVEIGQRVAPGQAVCIIEAMKLMNEIKADEGGKIVKILAKNEETVQEGQPLFLIEAE